MKTNQLESIRLGHKNLVYRKKLLNDNCPDLSVLPDENILNAFVNCIAHDLDRSAELADEIIQYRGRYNYSMCESLDLEFFEYFDSARTHSTRLVNILEKIRDTIEELPESTRHNQS